MIKQLYNSVRDKKDNNKKWQTNYKIAKLLANVLFPICASFQKKTGIDKDGKFTISLTSYPKRIDTVWITIASLLNQELNPEKVVLWLSGEQFPNKEKDLPGKLLKLKNRGLSIEFCDDDLKSHKKYYYEMINHPEETVITVDDDMLYPEDMTKQLWEAHEKYPGQVCCTYSHRFTYDDNGELKPYRQWMNNEESKGPVMNILPVGCGGVLYPAGALNKDLFDIEKIKRLCPKMDDLWLKSMAVINGTKSVHVKKGSLVYFNVMGTRKSRMSHENGLNNNDAMKAIISEYPEVSEIIRK